MAERGDGRKEHLVRLPITVIPQDTAYPLEHIHDAVLKLKVPAYNPEEAVGCLQEMLQNMIDDRTKE